MTNKGTSKQQALEPTNNDLVPFSFTVTVPSTEFCKEGDLLKLNAGDSLGLARVTQVQITCLSLALVNLIPAEEYEGKMYEWSLEYRKCDGDHNVLGVFRKLYLDVQGESEARKIHAIEHKKLLQNQEGRCKQLKLVSSMPAAEQAIHKAQWEVLKEVWPETINAIQDKVDPSKDYNAEMWARTGKPVRTVEVGDTETLPKLTKALRRKLVYDRVNVELATGWSNAGYQDMKPEDYTEKINTKLGTHLTVSAMKYRAVTKLGLTSRRSEGRPANDGELPAG